MKRELVDFFMVPDHHLPIHERLEGWARWVSTRRPQWNGPALWNMGKSNGRQWHQPIIRPATDEIDAQRLEKAVYGLPEGHREAIRWCYVHRTPPSHAKRALGVTYEGLALLVRDGRQMLKNRLTPATDEVRCAPSEREYA